MQTECKLYSQIFTQKPFPAFRIMHRIMTLYDKTYLIQKKYIKVFQVWALHLNRPLHGKSKNDTKHFEFHAVVLLVKVFVSSGI